MNVCISVYVLADANAAVGVCLDRYHKYMLHCWTCQVCLDLIRLI